MPARPTELLQRLHEAVTRGPLTLAAADVARLCDHLRQNCPEAPIETYLDDCAFACELADHNGVRTPARGLLDVIQERHLTLTRAGVRLKSVRAMLFDYRSGNLPAALSQLGACLDDLKQFGTADGVASTRAQVLRYQGQTLAKLGRQTEARQALLSALECYQQLATHKTVDTTPSDDEAISTHRTALTFLGLARLEQTGGALTASITHAAASRGLLLWWHDPISAKQVDVVLASALRDNKAATGADFEFAGRLLTDADEFLSNREMSAKAGWVRYELALLHLRQGHQTTAKTMLTKLADAAAATRPNLSGAALAGLSRITRDYESMPDEAARLARQAVNVLRQGGITGGSRVRAEIELALSLGDERRANPQPDQALVHLREAGGLNLSPGGQPENLALAAIIEAWDAVFLARTNRLNEAADRLEVAKSRGTNSEHYEVQQAIAEAQAALERHRRTITFSFDDDLSFSRNRRRLQRFLLAAAEEKKLKKGTSIAKSLGLTAQSVRNWRKEFRRPDASDEI